MLVRKDITRVEDLAGQPVNVDVAGSGTAMTASLMFERLGIRPQTTNLDQPTALERLKRGELAGIVFVSGQPVRLFQNISPDSGLHFVTVPLTDELAQTYLPAELSHASYPGLVDDGTPVATIAVGSVMAVFAFPPSNERYAKITRFVEAFFAKFPEPLKPPRHPNGRTSTWRRGCRAGTSSRRRRMRWGGKLPPAGTRKPERRACGVPCAVRCRYASDGPAARSVGPPVPQGAGTGKLAR